MRVKTVPRQRIKKTDSEQNFQGHSDKPREFESNMDNQINPDNHEKSLESNKELKKCLYQNTRPVGKSSRYEPIPLTGLPRKKEPEPNSKEEPVYQKSQENMEVMDLSKKKAKPSSHFDDNSNDKLKDTFLYKIMTDPMLVQNIRKDKISKQYNCPFCKQGFFHENDLNDHMEVRKDNTNQIACCACGKTFAQKRYLRYHQRCHSHRHKFTCEICTREYSRLDNLTRHNIFHTNPDKFSCAFCERTFARKDLLNKHQRCHENKHRFHCALCQKYFKGPLSLENHRKLVHPNA
ncbi:zinc finger and SCAN domain-containing protein 12 [Cephus cinctus]|uniref:Zinc finger and SCAN domain-containing protein 12 n=1 Tax=Cephus cinctus TaxID=211228 RepID=A0AAJ7C100_CEPCN|nr:zinc finger and SCAN domain-containing protein 12 [Cephus cinctus]